ncbi:MAG TPA: cytochrome c biogenesis protein CcsA [Candidatus Competibacteraceae bacterium]|nr:cytochrome c biogenesis protein CcsA [Candidatus Competibacteraceae bacterium]
MYNTFIGGLAAVLYLLTGGLLGVRLSRAGHGTLQGKPLLLALGGAAVLLHALILSRAILHPEGVNLGFFNALSLTGWLIAVVLLLSALLRPVENLGIVLLPFAATTVILALIFPSQRIVSDPHQWQLESHILISILAYSLLSLAAVQAILLAIQDHRLRSRHPGGFVRGIPPLVTMEMLLFQMIGIGFVMLSLALASGFLFLEDIFAQHLVHKTVLSIAAWTVFGILLWGRWRFGWRGRTAIRWTLSGFVVLGLAYFGSKLVLELILQR